ncbi:MAG TPA: tRNA (guanosine(37)-N1)-methyltransferase TrmD [Anaerohalosphaeraceae bacterium]|nr:tRNA (guanosine(37)-N1)-methyltransferase TrmD [Phycisphaerae bacterium]HOK95287.1 tRNA (guanosine(37)-N1)-methyltransferase TrmD [Anaerohalosphaeraceae bacterium]HOL31862.1 tRNA (guanosine(37)-N1)-methyltransferase TrmD [Anaerohalosphaeraceae bacterium]HOM76703.1 tRNA (guanosine(37)-N1)-methyltransferase TrmD [Anaerohalosphaeraceae bacterium]HPC65317.1 tRNA (guanosine(37)-N1)-methyltransferase TrmD [Anaerohalosphaeraceae bacterium]
MRIDVLTLFPEMFASPLSYSILKRAQEQNLVEIVLSNIRDFALDSYRKVDDKPYGGGPGMVMMPGPVFDCVEHVQQQASEPGHIILLTPQGTPLTQEKVIELSRRPRLVLIAGRYEGFDERIRMGLAAESISIGDYVLSGGELAAMVVIDAVVRLLPGALGDEDSAAEESHRGGLLEYPQYTRPEEFRGMRVPSILLGGDHGKIAQWRHQQRLERTRLWRPDLYEKYLKSNPDTKE